MKKQFLNLICTLAAWGACTASAQVAYVYCDEFYSDSFEYQDTTVGVGLTEPYYECTYKEPTYIEAREIDGNQCAEAWWTETPYDANPVRTRRGVEACSGNSTTELRFREDGWYGLRIRVPSGDYPTNKTCIVLQLFAHGRGGSWTGTLEIENNTLKIVHRSWLTTNHTIFELDADIERDTWIPIIIYWKPSTNPAIGKMKIWYDGDPKESPSYDYTGKVGFDAIDDGMGGWDDGWVDEDTMISGIGLKWGMYCADAANYTPDETRTLYYDDVTQLKGNPVGAWELVNPEGNGRDAFARIDAEYWSDESGVVKEVCTDTDGGFYLGDIQNSDWVAIYDVNFDDGADTFEARVASTNGGNIEIRLDSPTGTLLGSCPVGNTGGVESWATVSTDITTTSGKHHIYLKFTGGSGDLLSLNWFSFIGNELLPLTEKTQAEDYLSQSGTSLEACGDIGGGSNVAYISHGDWCQYNEVVPGAGGIFRARVARPNNKPDSAIEVRLGDSDGTLIATVDVPETGGWQTYHTVETDLPAVTGQYPLYLKFVETGTPGGSSIFNINWFELERTPVDYEAEAFAAQNGTTLEPCGDTGGGTNVANISNGDWCRYDNLFIASNAVFCARVARPADRPDGQIEIRADDLAGTLLGTVDVPETGGWQTYTTIDVPLNIAAGTYSVFLKFVEDGTAVGSTLFNINRFSITPSTQVNPPETLTAEAVDADRIDLSWSSLANASAYNVKRANTSGGSYSALVGGLSVTNHGDPGLLAGTNYFYVVTANYGSAESGYSVEVSAVPSAPLNEGDVVIDAAGIETNGLGGYTFTVFVDESTLGHNYQVLMSESLTEPDWQPATDVSPGNDGELTLEVPVGAETNLFYKLEAWRQ